MLLHTTDVNNVELSVVRRVGVRALDTAGNMAALMTLTQLSSGNPVYEVYYRQVNE
ncbi:unnamed protein product [Oncorhynchus mykiss]|uniref:Uncharacterized protein n=1 Tax=Oncorhynchus mykiss TaxID=8022 RepID=A0A060XZ95_ONCMY|nr:unnamed protein product [Oncorhynchus mykiss]